MEKKKLVKKLTTGKTVTNFGSIVILTCMAVLFAFSIVQLAFSILLHLSQGHGNPRSSSWSWRLEVVRKNDGEAANSPAEHKGEAGEGQM